MQNVGANLEDNGTPRRVQLEVNNVLDKTEKHLSMLCRAFSTVAQYATETRSATEGVDVPAELRRKATDSCVQLLHQLDNVVNDMKRWTADDSALEKHYGQLLKHAADAQEAQALEAQMKTLPSGRLPVHVYRLESGGWGAFLVQRRSAQLLGQGDSIFDALRDFDANAMGQEKKARRARKKPSKKADGSSSDQGAGPA